MSSSSNTMLWGKPALLVHVTVSPDLMVTDAGSNTCASCLKGQQGICCRVSVFRTAADDVLHHQSTSQAWCPLAFRLAHDVGDCIEIRCECPEVTRICVSRRFFRQLSRFLTADGCCSQVEVILGLNDDLIRKTYQPATVSAELDAGSLC